MFVLVLLFNIPPELSLCSARLQSSEEINIGSIKSLQAELLTLLFFIEFML